MYTTNRKVKCAFCLRKDKGTYVASPSDNKRRTYICSDCAEVCMFIFLGTKHFPEEDAP
jgi:hypothetical protein